MQHSSPGLHESEQLQLLPYECFSIVSHLPPHEVAEKLQCCVVPSGGLHSSQIINGQFEGKVNEIGFSIQRIIRYRNSFLPKIVGRFEPQELGTRIVIRLFPHPVILLFMAIMLSFPVVGGGMKILEMANHGKSSRWALLLPLAFLVCGYGLMMAGFIFEAKKAKQILLSVLNN